ncbi:MAG: dihydropteroate synthase [Pseudomonadota bacterium]
MPRASGFFYSLVPSNFSTSLLMNDQNLPSTASPAPTLMGIVNVTPDSFSDGGDFLEPAAAIDHGLALQEDGAGILDVGGESTRPGAQLVPEAEEIARILPVIEGLAANASVPISIDTRKPGVAIAAMEAGATLWNDVSALTYSAESLSAASRLDCQIVLMHAQGTPQTMQINPFYDDVVTDVQASLEARVQACLLAGIDRDRLILDPGIGFGKTLAHNLALIRALPDLTALGYPVLFGASRKRFIAALDRDGPAEDRVGGSVAAALQAARAGARILRIHDVAQTRQALAIDRAIIGYPS